MDRRYVRRIAVAFAVGVAVCAHGLAQQQAAPPPPPLQRQAPPPQGDPRREIEALNPWLRDNPKDASAYSRRAKAHRELRDFDAAIADFTKAIEFDDWGGLYYQERARTYLAMKRLKEAFNDLTLAIEKNQPLDPALYLERARVRLAGGDPDGAALDFNRVLAHHDGASGNKSVQAQAWEGLGVVEYLRGNKEAGEDAFRRAFEFDVDGQFKKNFEQDRAKAQRVGKIPPEDVKRRAQEIGIVRPEVDASLVDLWTRLITISGMDGSATMEIDSTGDWKVLEAAKERGKARTSENRITLTSENDQVWESNYSTYADEKGTIYLKIEAPPLAGVWSRGLAIDAPKAPVDPQLPGGWFWEKEPQNSPFSKTLIIQDDGSYELSISRFEKGTIEIRDGRYHVVTSAAAQGRGGTYALTEGSQLIWDGDADNLWTRVADERQTDELLDELFQSPLDVAALMYAMGHADKAMAAVNDVIQREPKNGDAYRLRGQIHADAKRYEEALADFAAAAQHDPEDAQTFLERAKVLDTLDRTDDALASYTRALSLDPKLADAHYRRGMLHQNAGRATEAEEDFSRVIELDPKHAMAHLHRGILRITQGRNDEGNADMARAYELNPEVKQNRAGTSQGRDRVRQ